jgi:hypothetical protein
MQIISIGTHRQPTVGCALSLGLGGQTALLCSTFHCILSALISVCRHSAIPHTAAAIKLLVKNEVIEKKMPKYCLLHLHYHAVIQEIIIANIAASKDIMVDVD